MQHCIVVWAVVEIKNIGEDVWGDEGKCVWVFLEGLWSSRTWGLPLCEHINSTKVHRSRMEWSNMLWWCCRFKSHQNCSRTNPTHQKQRSGWIYFWSLRRTRLVLLHIVLLVNKSQYKKNRINNKVIQPTSFFCVPIVWYSFFLIDHIRTAAIFLLCHAQGGKLECRPAVFQVASRRNIGNLTNISYQFPTSCWTASEKIMEKEKSADSRPYFKVKQCLFLASVS